MFRVCVFVRAHGIYVLLCSAKIKKFRNMTDTTMGPSTATPVNMPSVHTSVAPAVAVSLPPIAKLEG